MAKEESFSVTRHVGHFLSPQSLSCCGRRTSLMSSSCCSLSANRLHLSSSSRRASWVSARSSMSSMILRIFLRCLGVLLVLFSSSSAPSLSLCSNKDSFHSLIAGANVVFLSLQKWGLARWAGEDDNSFSCYLVAAGVGQPDAGHPLLAFRTTWFFLPFGRRSGGNKLDIQCEIATRR